MFYSTQIFTQAGLEGIQAVYATIAMATLNVLTTILSIKLVDHKSFGRRQLLYVGLLGMSLAALGLVICISLTVSQSN